MFLNTPKNVVLFKKTTGKVYSVEFSKKNEIYCIFSNTKPLFTNTKRATLFSDLVGEIFK